MKNILLIGGTKKARHLASVLEKKYNVHYSITKNPTVDMSKNICLHISKFTEVSLTKYLKSNNIDCIISSAHPYATTIHKLTKIVAKKLNKRFFLYTYEPWNIKNIPNCYTFKTYQDMANQVKNNNNYLLAIGVNNIGLFLAKNANYYIVPISDSSKNNLAKKNYSNLVIKDKKCLNYRKLITNNNISHLICKNSGSSYAYKKIAAAIELGLTIYMLEAPYYSDNIASYKKLIKEIGS